jgi:hypothetical protein
MYGRSRFCAHFVFLLKHKVKHKKTEKKVLNMVGEWKKMRKFQSNKRFKDKYPEKIKQQLFHGRPFSPKWKKHLEDLFEQKLIGRYAPRLSGKDKPKLSRLQRLYVEHLNYGGNESQMNDYLKRVDYTFFSEQRKEKICDNHKDWYKRSDWYEKNKERIKEIKKKYWLSENVRKRHKMISYLHRHKNKFMYVFGSYFLITKKMSDEEVNIAYLKMKAYNKQHRGEVIE